MQDQRDSQWVLLTFIIYALHLFSAMAGVASATFVVTAFLTGWPSIIAVLGNYLFRSKVSGSYLESHFRWQIRTFWFSVLWIVVSVLLAITVIGLPLAFMLLVVVGIWIIYRVLRGLWRLSSGRPMPIAAPVG